MSALSALIAGFSREAAERWLRRMFPSFDSSCGRSISLDAAPANAADAANFASARLLGWIRKLPGGRKDQTNHPVPVVAVRMKHDLHERSSRSVQFGFARRFLKDALANTDPALGLDGLPLQGLFFFYDDDGFFRISLVSGTLGTGRRGSGLTLNDPKRQSFYVDPRRPNNIVRRRFAAPVRNFEELKDAFSVEKLTKEFYGELFEWYEWAMKPETGVTFPNDPADDTDDRKQLAEAVIRLITRLMFTWFVRQRGIVPDVLFTAEGAGSLIRSFHPEAMDEDGYYRCILQNLFFATFNCQAEKRGFTKHVWQGRCSSHGVKVLYRHRDELSDPAAFLELLRGVPYLNCALFDCLDRCEVSPEGAVVRELLLDGFSNTRKRQARVPNGLFFGKRGIIRLFDTYEFTVDENEADDADVALDPELLGKVFENLLGAYNPETSETARKATGSFYTPREIVDYMVEEALRSHLKTRVPGLSGEALDDLFDRTKAGSRPPLSGPEAKAVLDALYSCRILDPACGSGAFPMGVLHCMVRLFARLDPDSTDLNARLIERYREESRLELEPGGETGAQREEALRLQLAEGQTHPDYARKLYLIENCIYGVDIQPIAAQISKLRFFISLLCDQFRSSWKADAGRNYGLMTLPNLEAKFVCANTLAGLPGEAGMLPTEAADIRSLRERLQKNRHRIFGARDAKRKAELKERDREIRLELRRAVCAGMAQPDESLISAQESVIARLREDRKAVADRKMAKRRRAVQNSLLGAAAASDQWEVYDANQAKRDAIDAGIRRAEQVIAQERAKADPARVGAAQTIASLVSGWDPYDQNACSPFFDPEWMFDIRDGFDIVIGNPPYVQLQADGGRLAGLYAGKGYATFENTGDLYCLFYERGNTLLKSDGSLCFITSDKWMRNDYGVKLRQYFMERTDCRLLVDFAGQQIFNAATVEANILLFQKRVSSACNPMCCTMSDAMEGELKDNICSKLSPCEMHKNENWIVISQNEQNIFKKIKKFGKQLKEWNVEIYRGVLTGLNAAFVIDEQKRAQIISADPKSEEIIKPVLRGKDIHRYGFDQKVYLISTFPSINIYIDDYIGVKRHLLSFDKRILSQTGEKNIGGVIGKNARKKTNGKWFETQDQIQYYEYLSKQKIVWGEISDVPKFGLDLEGNYYCEATSFFMTGNDLPYIYLFLNSKLCEFYFSKVGTRTGMGTLRWKKYKIEEIPIVPNYDINLVNEIIQQINNEKQVYKELENRINAMIYNLYELSDEEIALVEGATSSGPAEIEEPKPSPRRRSKPLPVAPVHTSVPDEEDLD